MNPLYVESQMLKLLRSDNHQTKNRISKKLTECVFVLLIFNSLIINPSKSKYLSRLYLSEE